MKYARVFGLVIIVSLLATVPDVQVNAEQPGSVSFATVSNAGWSEVGVGSASGGGISNNNGISSDPSMVIAPDGTPYVAWSDESSGAWQIYVRRWDASSWAEVGSGSATGGGISDNTGESSSPVRPLRQMAHLTSRGKIPAVVQNPSISGAGMGAVGKRSVLAPQVGEGSVEAAGMPAHPR
jgi:hypothetical protein